MPLFNKKNLENKNPYGISEKDMIRDLDGFPVGVVVRMLEEAELQGNEPNVKVFQEKKEANKNDGGFDWDKTFAYRNIRRGFWSEIIRFNGDRKEFFEVYPEYEKYN